MTIRLTFATRLSIATLLSLGFWSHAATAQDVESSLPLNPVIRSAGVPIFENLTLTPNFTPDPSTVRGISGGEVPASDITGRADTATGPCNGFVDAEPDHTFTLTSFFEYLSLQIESTEDTTLVIRGPGGNWCNDDYLTNNPGIAGEWLSGTYEIWIGSYEEGTYHPYVIRVSGTEQTAAQTSIQPGSELFK